MYERAVVNQYAWIWCSLQIFFSLHYKDKHRLNLFTVSSEIENNFVFNFDNDDYDLEFVTWKIKGIIVALSL